MWRMVQMIPKILNLITLDSAKLHQQRKDDVKRRVDEARKEIANDLARLACDVDVHPTATIRGTLTKSCSCRYTFSLISELLNHFSHRTPCKMREKDAKRTREATDPKMHTLDDLYRFGCCDVDPLTHGSDTIDEKIRKQTEFPSSFGKPLSSSRVSGLTLFFHSRCVTCWPVVSEIFCQE